MVDGFSTHRIITRGNGIGCVEIKIVIGALFKKEYLYDITKVELYNSGKQRLINRYL